MQAPELWEKLRLQLRRPVVLAPLLVLVGLGLGFLLFGRHGAHAPVVASAAPGQAQGAPAVAASPANPPGTPPVELVSVKNRFCRALAPQGWAISDQDKAGAIFALTSADGSMSAAYGDEPVGAALRAGGAALMARLHAVAPYLAQPQLSPEQLGAQYSSPTSTVEYTLRKLYGPDTQFTGSASDTSSAYQLLKFASATKRGAVIFRVFTDGQGDQAILLRIAAVNPGGSDKDIAEAAGIAASINCRQEAKPPPPPPAQTDYQGAKPDSDSASQKCPVWSPSCDDSDFAGTYNAQLGTGYVHSASGTDYLVDADSDKWETGPDGPGFYIKHANGNLEKLQPGLDDSD